MAEVAATLRKSVRWLQIHLRDHPYGRIVGRSRLFTDDDLSALIASFPAETPRKYRPSRGTARAVPQMISSGERTSGSEWTEALRLATSGKRKPSSSGSKTRLNVAHKADVSPGSGPIKNVP
jgi:hypothetical protein